MEGRKERVGIGTLLGQPTRSEVSLGVTRHLLGTKEPARLSFFSFRLSPNPMGGERVVG